MDTVPPQNSNEGDFNDTLNIQLLVSYDGQWVPTSLLLTAQQISNNYAQASDQ